MLSSRSIGLLLGALSALIGGGWQVMTRSATTAVAGPVPPEDLVLLRYGVPTLCLLPLLWRLRAAPCRGRCRRLGWLVLCAGLPFGWVAVSGTRHAPASHMGVMMAGASPLIAALLAWALWRERPDRARGWGLACMGLGIGLLAAQTLAGWSLASWRGDALFLLAATLWAGYTLGARGSPWSAWELAALVNAASFGAALLLLALRGTSSLPTLPLSTLATQLLWQGVLAGVFGLWTYTAAIQRLGAPQAAAFGALAPVVSALGGWAWLGEPLAAPDALAIGVASVGVLLASGALGRAGKA